MPGEYTENQDGSISIPDGSGKEVRFVKESDLLAVKGAREQAETGWETEKAQLRTDLAEANRLRDEAHQGKLQAQAAYEQQAEQFKDYDTYKTRLGELETQNTDLTNKITGYETELTDRIRNSLVSIGGNEEALKEKDLTQLKNLEEAATILGKTLTPNPNYDNGHRQHATAETAMDRARRVLAEHEERGHRMGTSK